MNAQTAITASFSQNASSAWGQYANQRYVDAVNEGDEEAAGCWGPDGSCRAAGHAVVGGLSGGVVGAVGAGLSSEMAPAFADFLHGNDVPEAIVQALTVAAASGVSSVFGAGAAAGAFNESANNAIVAVPLILEALVAAGEAAVLSCVRSPKCVALIGATVLDNLLSTNSSQNQGDGNSESGAGPTGGNQADTYGTPPNGANPPPDEDQNRSHIDEKNIDHIFRDAEGHLPDTPANRELLENVANNPQTRLGVDKWGNTWHATTDANGNQIWAQVRGNRIVNGGAKNPPKTWNPSTGLSAQTPPKGK